MRGIGTCICLLIAHFICPGQDTSVTNVLRYSGSSTIGNFVSDASEVYPEITFSLDTRQESSGGEAAILEGATDLAGVARRPDRETQSRGIVSTLIGWDAIAVIVHPDNPISNLNQSQLKRIFTGLSTHWSEFGGPHERIRPYVVSVESATHKVFRSVILGEENYHDCQTVVPDAEILKKIAADRNSIGHISNSFINPDAAVKVISVNQQVLSLTNARYPITRPLYFLWWPGRRDIAAFVNWTLSGEGQRVVMSRFIGAREGTFAVSEESGTLIVFTPTTAVEDGGVFYYPHNAYEILKTDRTPVMRIANNMNRNDEIPTRVALPPGNYLIKTEVAGGPSEEFFVAIETNKVSKVFADGEDRAKQPRGQSDPGPKTGTDRENRLPQIAWYGDFRIRAAYDHRFSGNRFRGRFRIRAGMTVPISQALKFDLRLASSNNPDDPNSTHVELDRGLIRSG